MMSAHLNQPPVPPGRIRPGVPAALDDLVMELLAKAPEDRPVSAAQVHDRLRAALSSPTPSGRACTTACMTWPRAPPTPGAPGTPHPPAPRRPRWRTH